MKKIGLTGGIGSGKSTIAQAIKHIGYPVYIADKEAARLMDSHPDIRKDITERLGANCYTSEGHINKPVLAQIIFENKEALEEVNRIVHPRVMEAFEQWAAMQSASLVFCETAILYESGLERYFDAVICVTAPEEVRVRRVMERDHCELKDVMARVRNQMDEDEKCQRANFVIYNDGEHMAVPQVLDVLHKLQTNS